ncbi:hypothetical protein COW09_00065 [bacterium (Candidatus Moisslbacteria) CG12_big_fil_rev_8_21_14_0_65_36_11]|nr:DUF342 domain-containing protein [Candidatus Kuenenbacteria bacterium]OIP77325.1 MAG: hypothetical protein AUK09_00015 [Parcubacteria group bacterium CG2_30_36_38]PIW68187.1 MAG: hypothetical protein COW09_00065 [bacterium (Candidatus Moisslbacteria) CG12_big_fil_rev_8_21_14_0_65_36_11]PJC00908.1 MAG: hypothetical protein CO074_00010 [bacterium (Candidatus Moisslbacteria) CG_4_9_14_0_8_um_filter_36_20]
MGEQKFGKNKEYYSGAEILETKDRLKETEGFLEKAEEDLMKAKGKMELIEEYHKFTEGRGKEEIAPEFKEKIQEERDSALEAVAKLRELKSSLEKQLQRMKEVMKYPAERSE